MNNREFLKWLKSGNADPVFITWVGERSFEEAWSECLRLDWMIWLRIQSGCSVGVITLANLLGRLAVTIQSHSGYYTGYTTSLWNHISAYASGAENLDKIRESLLASRVPMRSETSAELLMQAESLLIDASAYLLLESACNRTFSSVMCDIKLATNCLASYEALPKIDNNLRSKPSIVGSICSMVRDTYPQKSFVLLPTPFYSELQWLPPELCTECFRNKLTTGMQRCASCRIGVGMTDTNQVPE